MTINFRTNISYSEDILIHVKAVSIFGKVFGIQNLDLKNKNITHNHKFYRIYIKLFTTSIMAYFMHSTQYAIRNILSNSLNSTKITYSLTQISLLLSYMSICRMEFRKNVEKSIKRFKSLSKIDEILKFDSKTEKILNKKFKIAIYIWHIGFILFKTLHFQFEYFIWEGDGLPWVVQLVIAIVDLVISYFIVEIGMLSRRFEKLNFRLKNNKVCRNVKETSINFNVQNTVLMKFWKNPLESCSENFGIEPNNLIKVYKLLLDVLKSIEDCYGFLVN